MSADDLTGDEARAIASLQRLARRWPQTLTLFSWSGSLVVFHSADMDAVADGGRGNDLILDDIVGIPNGGGDP